MKIQSTPDVICTQEVRFAVVMYGGVSLAIYINGIAQELLHMVRSTARDATGDRALLFDSAAGTGAANDDGGGPLSATERVYRKLSYLLANPDLLNEYRQFLKSPPAKDQPAADDQQVQAAEEKDISRKLDKILAENSEPINTRFVVDIMSGTSAGGINSIYLAKAMANDQPIDQLKNLWLNEGDIALLINDKESVAGLQMGNQNPPQSLLNSRRMYLKLLRSFDDMESKKASVATFVSPYVDELDLYITATDLAGLTVPIRLSDSVVYEKRHRHVFHFKYSTLETTEASDGTGSGGPGSVANGEQPNLRNDFLAANNPFLAFAARCTSSFPFAFEPMKLCDIDDVLKTSSGYRDQDELAAQKKAWNSFFRENLDPDTRRRKIAFEERPFGDGGYLDNKPFSYTTEMLMRRDAPVPVDRKLVYIEPSPEHPEDETDEPTRIDALQNVKAALLELPTYETIREDLEKVIQRNSLIGRVNRITAAIERDLDETRVHRPVLKGGEWQTFDLADMVNRFGIYYLPYRRLRISAATDELAKIVARIAGLDENSADFYAIRVLIRAWREINYRDYHKNPQRADSIDELADRLASAVRPRRVAGEVANAEEDDARRAEIISQLRTWMQINCADSYTKQTAAPPSSNPAPEKSDLTANQFLIDYDFQYWLRRLTFVRGKLDQLYRLNRKLLRKEPGDLTGLTAEQRAIVKRIEKPPFEYSQLPKGGRKELQTLLEYLKFELSDIYRTLRAVGRKIQSAPSAPASSPQQKTFHEIVKDFKIESALINYLLGLPKEAQGEEPQFSRLNEDECVTRARKLLEPPHHESASVDAVTFKAPELASSLQAAAAALKIQFAKAITDKDEPTSIWSRCRALLDPRTDFPEKNERWGKPMPTSPHAKGMREYLWRYLSQFDDFDQVRFPILFGTDVGESDVVEIIRISPEDAPSLISERSPTEKRRKLAGTSLFHFGAFLDRTWRQNDIMWGRLDGAERLITSLLPDAEYEGTHIDNSKVRAALIEEAQTAILLDELPRESRNALGKLMTDALTQASAGDEMVDAINKVVAAVKNESPTMKPLQQVMLNTLRDENLLEFMKKGYEVNRKLDAKSMLRALSRSTQVIGSIFEDIANTNGLDGKNLAWIARLGKIFWGLVEVAVPDSIIHLLFTHWLKLLYLFEALMLIGGTVLVRPTIQQFGFLAFALTLATNLAVFFLHDEMEGRRGRFRIVKVLAILLGIALFLTGLVALTGLLGVQPIWRWMLRLNGWFSQDSVWHRWTPAVLAVVLLIAAIRDDLRLVWRKYTRWLSAFKGEPYGG
jgi:patatin-related protein